MVRPSFRAISPKGLYARSVLLTLVPVIVVLLLMTLYYFNGHLRTVNTKLSQGVARQILLVQETCRTDRANMSVHAYTERYLSLKYNCDYSGGDERHVTAQFFYADLVKEQIDNMIGVQTMMFTLNGKRQLDIRIPDNDRVMRVVLDRKRVIDINGHVFIVWVALLSLFMGATALAFLRNHVRSVLRLTEAAQAFGRGQDLEGFRPSGASEVRAAAQAVIEMRARLTRFAEQRTMMLAGVSHDLRTPLTRLQLQLAMQEQTEDVLEARADIRDMEAMLDEYLAFARGEAGERAEPVELSKIVREAVSKFSEANMVEDKAQGVEIKVRPMAVKRAVFNLLQNAATYGDKVEVRLEIAEGMIVLCVEDDGPGIQEANYEEAFEPFTRLNDARTQNIAGVGLGLGLARDTARTHGGHISLGRSGLGGLQVRMFLPL